MEIFGLCISLFSYRIFYNACSLKELLSVIDQALEGEYKEWKRKEFVQNAFTGNVETSGVLVQADMGF